MVNAVSDCSIVLCVRTHTYVCVTADWQFTTYTQQITRVASHICIYMPIYTQVVYCAVYVCKVPGDRVSGYFVTTHWFSCHTLIYVLCGVCRWKPILGWCECHPEKNDIGTNKRYYDYCYPQPRPPIVPVLLTPQPKSCVLGCGEAAS